jgi:NADH-quinone oxidoreductase subunit L
MIFLGKRLPRQGDWLANGLLFVCLGLSFYILFAFNPAEPVISRVPWLDWGIGLGIVLDNLSAVMLVVVCLISALSHLFSIKYMEGDVRYNRYFAYLGIFTFSMLGIVLADNLLMMYIFWELVGFSSYILIGYWYEKPGPQYASKKAFIVNRIGDIGFFSGIMMIFVFTGSFNLTDAFAAIQAGKLSGAWLTAAGILVFCGAIGKSAQFPLHVWLPDAMEGPTPVSALIHAATMVAAGVYLVARTYAMMSADALTVIAYIGMVSAFIPATIAVTQNDIKRVLAYSTISQLGLMIMALGISAYTPGFMHLVTHASFKACLFLGAGSVIIALHHEQDIRKMGGLKNKLPVTYWTFLIAALALSGIPLTSGFLSKDSILAGTISFASLTGGINYMIPVFAFIVTGLTAFYMFRLIFLVFHGTPKHSPLPSDTGSRGEVLVVKIPLLILAAFSLFFFYSFNPLDAGSGWLAKYIAVPSSVVPEAMRFFFQTDTEAYFEAFHHAHYIAMFLSLLCAGGGILLAAAFYYWKKFDAESLKQRVMPLYAFSLNKWYFDELYDLVFVRGTLMISRALRWFDDKIIDGAVNGAAYITRQSSFGSRKFDDGIIDGLVNFTASVVMFFGLLFRKIQTGRIQTYLAYVVFGIIVFYFIFRSM